MPNRKSVPPDPTRPARQPPTGSSNPQGRTQVYQEPEPPLVRATKKGPDAICDILWGSMPWIVGPRMKQYGVWGEPDGTPRENEATVLKYPPGTLECPWEFFTTKWTIDTVKGQSPEGRFVPQSCDKTARLAQALELTEHSDLKKVQLPPDYGPGVWRTQIGQKAIHETRGGAYGLPILRTRSDHEDTQVLRYPDITLEFRNSNNWPLYIHQLYTLNQQRIADFELKGNPEEAARIKACLGDLPKIAAVLRALNSLCKYYFRPWFWKGDFKGTWNLRWMKTHLKQEHDRHKEEGTKWNEELTILRLYIEHRLGIFYHTQEGRAGSELKPYTPLLWPLMVAPRKEIHAFNYWSRIMAENMRCAERLFDTEIRAWTRRQGGNLVASPIQAWDVEVRKTLRTRQDTGPVKHMINRDPIEQVFSAIQAAALGQTLE